MFHFLERMLSHSFFFFHLCIMDFITEHQEVLLYIAAAIIVLVLGLVRFRYDIMFLFSKKETQGTITNWMAATQEGKRYFYPMIEFYTEDNSKISFRAEERSEGKPMYQPGTKVTIQYLSKKTDFRKVIYPS